MIYILGICPSIQYQPQSHKVHNLSHPLSYSKYQQLHMWDVFS